MSVHNNDLISMLKQTLSQDKRFITENGELVKASITSASMQLEPEFINLLLSNDMIKRSFFTEIEGVLVFDKVKFNWVVNNKKFLPDSYTKYKNKIGLSNNDYDLITDHKDISLVWPYKDTILEGGQTKDEEEKNEIFYNETLAPDQVRNLLSPKALTNAKRYTENGVEDVLAINNKDNLIIKGNNLLALSSLTENYREKIKFIYIDPPYNTESDSFNYNDNFSRSTWLTFMQNRLMEAWKLLKKDGVLAVQCSFHNYAYLKVMMDSIFGEEREVMTFNVLVRHPERSLTADKEFNDVVEYVLIYSKSEKFIMPKIEKEKTPDDYIYQVEILEEPSEIIMMNNKNVEVYLPDQYKKIKGMPDKDKFKTHSIRGSLREKNSSGRFYVKYLEVLKDNYPPMTLFKVPNMGDDKFKDRYFHLPQKGNKNGTYFQGMPQSSEVTKIPYPNFLDFVQEYNVVNAEGEVSFRNGKKPENLVFFLMNLFTQENDIVLDFFMGSGTTQAVAHKTNRQYIGIEQMDYINTITTTRLENVINGEQEGISKEVRWTGGGSFVYMELKELSEKYIQEIKNIKNTNQLIDIYMKLKEKGSLKPSLETKVLEDEALFNQLSFDEQKDIVVSAIDKNKLYVNANQIEDKEIYLSDYEKELTSNFYRKESSNDAK